MGYELYNDDCAQALAGFEEQANLVLTSPPYDGLREYGGHGFDFDSVATAVTRALAPGGVLVWIVGDATVHGSETGTSLRHALGFMDRGLKLHDTMIYEQAHVGPWAANRYDQNWQYMFVFSRGVSTTANILQDKPNARAGRVSYMINGLGRNKDKISRVYRPQTTGGNGRRGNIWRYSVGLHKSAPDFNAAHQHPAIFPLALAKDHILTWTKPGDLVIDPMAGSGTTLRAAVDLGRRAVGIEIQPGYCQLIERRMAQQVLL